MDSCIAGDKFRTYYTVGQKFCYAKERNKIPDLTKR